MGRPGSSEQAKKGETQAGRDGRQGDAMRKGLMMALSLAGAVAPALAQADSRQDVVNQLARCAVLTDDRQWLDCYYGAAQPMRAQLGLSPAPQADMSVLRAPTMTSIPTRVAPAATAAPAMAAVRKGPPPMPKQGGILDLFGGDEVVHNAPVRDYQLGGGGFTVTLADGQVWEQTPDDATKSPVSWRDPASSMHVTVRRGAMRTFNLVMNDENVHHKVKRVR